MKLLIAEKPDLGRNIAQYLPGPMVKKDGYIQCGQDWIVTWVFGHMLSQVGPEAYDEKYKQWKMADLPIIPKAWEMEVSDSGKKQFRVIRDLHKTCSSVVHAGDPDREGQLIIDELLVYLKNKKPVERILVNATDATTIKKALANLEDNTKYFPLYEAALGRQRSDWLIGMSLTRAYTILGREQHGHRGVLSLGRVQTPTLAIVVKRDLEIENFVAKDFWSVQAQFADPGQPAKPFWTRWVPDGAVEEPEDGTEMDEATLAAAIAARPAWLDASNRVIDRNKAQEVVDAVKKHGFGEVSKYSDKPAKEAPPMPFDLNSLQSHIIAKTGCGAKDVLEAAQKLYQDTYLTYPRSSCQFLKTEMRLDAPKVLQGMQSNIPELQSLAANADPSLQTKAWNDAKVTEHHGIIPTLNVPNLSSLSKIEREVYLAAAKRYIAQFYPDCDVRKARIEVMVDSRFRFVTSGRIVTNPGWRVVYGGQTEEEMAEAAAGKTGDDENAALPSLTEGSKVDVKDSKINTHRTTPPPRFTEGTLLAAMEKVSNLVDDPIEKKKLKALSGIGQPATRTPIIETLIKREFLLKEKGKIISSPVGRALIASAPKALTEPGLTARWETVLDAIAQGKAPLALFMQKQVIWVQQLISAAQATQLAPIPASPAPASGGGRSGGSGSRSGSSGSRSGSSSSSKPSSGGAGKSKSAGSLASGATCPKCGKGKMMERTVKNGPKAGSKFLGCSNYPNCNHSEWPK
jgi:DNA topoisomerase III